MSQIFRKESYYNQQLQFDLSTISQDKKELQIVKDMIEIAHIVENIELKWCPFKAMVDYYRNTNPNYVYPVDRLIYLAGEAIAKNDTVRCNLCNDIVNKVLESDKYTDNSGDYSPMKDFFEELLNNL